MVAVGRVAELPGRLGPDVVVAHQLGHGIEAASGAAGLELGMHARAAVALLDLGVDGSDLHEEGVPALLQCADRARTPGVEALGRDTEGFAQHGHGPGLPVLLDEGEDHSASLAKKAVAFFKMS